MNLGRQLFDSAALSQVVEQFAGDFCSHTELLLDERNGGLGFQYICQQRRIRVLQLGASMDDSSRGQRRRTFRNDRGPSIGTYRSTGRAGVWSARNRVSIILMPDLPDWLMLTWQILAPVRIYLAFDS